jgi:CheY-like chemotaxis protein
LPYGTTIGVVELSDFGHLPPALRPRWGGRFGEIAFTSGCQESIYLTVNNAHDNVDALHIDAQRIMSARTGYGEYTLTVTQDVGDQLEQDLVYLGLLDKAHEIYTELGKRAAVSFLKSSYKLLSKVYHPDLNPTGNRKAKITQQVLNRVRHTVSDMSDDEIAHILNRGLLEDHVARNRILIVEDESGIQRALQRILTMEGYDSKIAIDGVQGYEKFIKFKPRLLFCDIVMPGIDGLELLSKIRKSDPKIKVIYMSGFFDVTPLQARIEREVLRYGYRTLAKPFKPSVVLAMVKAYLDEDSGENRGIDTIA